METNNTLKEICEELNIKHYDNYLVKEQFVRLLQQGR